MSSPDVGPAEIEEMIACVQSGWVSTGARTQDFESALGDYLGARHVRCLNSCTAGLFLSLRLLDVKPGDDVLVPSITFAACANVVEQLGARPVMVDSQPLTGLIDLEAAEALIGPQTRALLVVHLAGRPLDMDRVNDLRDRRGIPIIEDAAHAIGAEWRGRKIGAFGNLTAFSFHASKNLTTFDGGALVVRDEDEWMRVQRLATQGLSRIAWTRHGDPAPAAYDITEPGFKLAMHDVAASVGIHQLARLDGRIAFQERLAQAYDRALGRLPLELAPPVAAGGRHSRQLYIACLPADGRTRDDVAAALQRRGIGTSVHFRGLHLQSFYKQRYSLDRADLPIASEWSDRAISLPLHPNMDETDVATVADAIADEVA